MSLATQLFQARRRMTWTRDELLQYQAKQLESLVHYAMKHSTFYRDLYGQHGISTNNLDGISVTDLPIVDKQMIMDHFDDVVTDSQIRRTDLEAWIAEKPKAKERYHGYKVLHSSGTSGRIGLYVYDRRAWNTLKASVMTYIALYQQSASDIMQKHRLAYFAATHGLFAGVTLITDAPIFLYDVKTFSVLESFDKTLKEMQGFQPTRIGGYSSTVTQIAQAQKDQRINIHPHSALVGGDPLSTSMRRTIEEAWPHIQITDFYAASESIGIAARRPGESLYTVFDDLHIVELLNAQNYEVAEGESGEVVLTNLYNQSFPLIRYRMHDVATRGPVTNEHSTFQAIHGRLNDALPIVSNNGSEDFVHPIVLSEFFVPGVEKVQFVSRGDGDILIRFIGQATQQRLVQEVFQDILKKKQAEKKTICVVEHVDDLQNDPTTGKYRLVVK